MRTRAPRALLRVASQELADQSSQVVERQRMGPVRFHQPTRARVVTVHPVMSQQAIAAS